MLPKPIWLEDGKVFLIDQTKLPVEVDVQEIQTAEQMWDAIKRLVVRGAPAIGLAAAFGVYLGIMRKLEAGALTAENFVVQVKEICRAAGIGTSCCRCAGAGLAAGM